MPRSFIYVILFLFGSSIVYGQNPSFPPRNEVALDSSLERFVVKLLQAIDKRDAAFLLSVLDNEVSGVIGGEGGITEFSEIWEPENPASPIWPRLKRIIEMGGVFLQDMGDETGKYQFVFPYIYDIDFGMEEDYFHIGVITGKNVNMREKPDTRSPVLRQLTYDVIYFLVEEEEGEISSGTNEFGDPEWYQIDTYDHRQSGWVHWRYVYSPMEYRLFLYKTGAGYWKISAFLAGD